MRAILSHLTLTYEGNLRYAAEVREDIRYTLRQLRRSPWFTVFVTLVLALGIGLNVALFTVVDTLLRRPLPGVDTDRIMTVWERNRVGELNGVSGNTIRYWREHSRSFEEIVAAEYGPYTVSAQNKHAESVRGVMVTGDYFRLYRAHALLGRTFASGEDGPAAPLVVVLDYKFWQRYFGGDDSVINRQMRLDGRPATVIGVMPPDFHPTGAEFVSLYEPLVLESKPAWNFWTVARLRDGVSFEQAGAEMKVLSEQLAKADANKKFVSAYVVPMVEMWRKDIREGLLLAFGAVLIVLLIVCLNTGSLLLARAAGRAREHAIRAALGGGRWVIVRQVLTEAMLLAGAGGLLGLLVAWAAVRLAAGRRIEGIGRLDEVSINATVVGFALAATIVTAVFASLLPSLLSLRTKASLHTTRQTNAPLLRSFQRVMISAEVALTFLLVTAAATLTITFMNLGQVELGYRPDHLIAFSVTLPPGDNAAQILSMTDRITRELAATAGVESVSRASITPTGTGIGITFPIQVFGQTPATGEKPEALANLIDPNYFSTTGISLLRGRAFHIDDSGKSERVVIVSEGIARRFFPYQDPVGRKLMLETVDTAISQTGAAVPHTIVGVASDVRQSNLRAPQTLTVYIPFAQSPVVYLSYVVRSRLAPETLIPVIPGKLAAIDAELPALNLATMQESLDMMRAPTRRAAAVFVGSAVLALFLAVVGLYGVIAYAVSTRTTEFGVRMALGAARKDVLRLVIREAIRFASFGAIGGVGLAVAMRRVGSAALYGIAPDSPSVLIAVLCILIACVVAASALPARRASQLQPMEALRHE